MGRYIRWQAILTLAGIALIMAFLASLALSRTTIIVPDKGGIYKEGIVGVPQFVNPLLVQYNQVDQDLGALIFNGLTRMDGDGNLQPDLAARWQVSEDGLIYEFKLRPNIRWQDGERFSVDDVLFTIGLMQSPEFPGVPYLHQLWQTVEAEKVGDDTIRFTLPEPLPAFAEFTTIGILPQHLFNDMPASDLLKHPFNLNPIGTGPFKLDDINSQAARLSLNSFYKGTKSRLAGLELRFYPTFQDVIQAYEAGEIHGISFIPPEAHSQTQRLNSLDLYTARLSGYDIIYFNLQNPDTVPFLQDVTVRKALASSLNRQSLIDQALQGQGLLAHSPILPWSWAYNPQQSTIPFDPIKARNLLDEIGWLDRDGDGTRDKEGQPLTFKLLINDDPTKLKLAKTIKNQWQQLGISITIEMVGDNLKERLITHDFEAALVGVLLAGDPDPYPFWHQTQIDGGQNYAAWEHAEASKLLAEARSITDRGQRNDYYFEFQRIFAEEMPALILFHPLYSYGINQEVFGVQLAPMITPGDRFRTMSQWYMLTQQVIYSETQSKN